MKYLLTLPILLMVFCHSVFSQCVDREKPLNPYAYKKMMRGLFNFTILGTQAPVSGFKVETTKPTITLKGNIFSNTKPDEDVDKLALIINLELTAGGQDDIQDIFSGNELNGYFKANLGFNVLFEKGNNAKFTLDKDTSKFEWNIRRATGCAFMEDVAKQIDTAIVLYVISERVNRYRVTYAQAVDSIVKYARNDTYTIDGYSEPDSAHKWKRSFKVDTLNRYYDSLLSKILISYGADSNLQRDALFDDFIQKINSMDLKIKYEQLLADTKKAAKFKKRRYKYQLIDDDEIKTYDDIWTRKRIMWLNLSLTGLNSSFKLYDAPTNTLLDSNSFLPGISVTYNFFNKAAKSNKYFYLRAGFNIKRVNSLVDLKKFDYKQETVINVSPTESLKKEKDGTAYQGALAHGVGFDIPFEMYWAPWKPQYVPGFYGKLMYSYGKPWINKNKVSLDLGMVWNVTNDDKDAKNILTIVPYISWSNLLKEYEEVQKINEKKLSELFSVGVKFGIPVNLGK